MDLDTSTVPLPRPRGPREKFRDLLRAFSPSERLTLYILLIVLSLSTFVLIAQANGVISSSVPAAGGTLIEGGVGVPRFVNPVLATTQIDLDVSTLTYSGLLRLGKNGDFVPDLAESFGVSEDGTVYTFHLREGLTFHDGEPLTSSDVLFTVALAQNPDIKSPRRADWEGVAVAAPDEHTVVFTLPHAYAPFVENATLGVLPRHLWQDVPPDEFPFHALNTHPIGSGPYAVKDVVLDSTGAATEYRLRSFGDFALGAPHISNIVYRAYANEDALRAAAIAGEIESFVASSPKTVAREVQERGTFMRIPLTRIFGIFLNQNHAAALADASARHALDSAIDKNALVAQILGGYGTSLNGPISEAILPPTVAGAATTTESESETGTAAIAQDILVNGGWKQAGANSTSTNPGSWTKGGASLSITLATADTEELVETANAVAEAWRAAGIPTEVKVYPLQEFNQSVLRPRQYDAIVFGEAVGRSLDLFPFWHSSQRNDPGLNLSLYTNADADRALASARAATKREEREAATREFLTTLAEDDPAVFLYSPEIAYLVPSYLQGVEIGALSSPSERFASVHEWYRDTERVWDVFTK